MSEDFTPDNIPEASIEETRRKKMEEFRRGYDPDAIRGEYDAAAPAEEPDESSPTTMVYERSESSGARGARSVEVGDYDVDFDVDDPIPEREDDSEPSCADDDYDSAYRRRRSNEINSFSDSDTRMRIERDSRKALKEQKKEDKRIERSKAKRNRRIFKWIWLSMVAIVAIVLAQFIIVGVNDMLAIDRNEDVRTVNVSIPANPSLDQIADILRNNGVINKPYFFKLYTGITSSEKGFRQGEFKLDTNKDYEAIINTLQSNTSRTDIVSVQITEGMSVIEIANLLHDQGVTADIQEFLDVCNSDTYDEDYEFLKKIDNPDERYYKLEGYLFPDTYFFYLNEDPEMTVEKMLYNYETKVVNHKEKYFGNSKKSTLENEMEKTGYTADEILTIASIIQAEAANKDDMYTISSILHNRLKYGGAYGVAKLNCDCTVYYPYRKLSDVPESIRATYTSRYDTNTFDGLPPGPICNPGAEAIKAAVNPYSTDYLYFCHDTIENGSTPYYSTTLDEHNHYLSLIGHD